MYIYFFISDFFLKKNERTKTNDKAEIERRAKRLRELAASVPPEPSADAKNLCTLAIRWPDGRSISRRFDANEKLSVVKAFCEAQDKLPAYSKLCLVQKKKSFILLILLFYFFTNNKKVCSFPRRVLQEDDQTLSALKLTPNAVLLVDVE